jgi:hypothetical protein
MMTIAHPPKRESLFAGGVGSLGANLRRRAHELPGLDLVLAGLESWWRQSPARTAGVVAAGVSQRVVAPVARKKPGGVVLVALGLGMLLALSRPWRLLLRPAFLFGVLSQIALYAVKRMPFKSWLYALGGSASSTSKSEPTAQARTTVDAESLAP